MREILFRGKRLTTNTWEYGSCVIDGEKALIFINEHTGTYVDPETIGQDTGLKDKEGNRIFEGDLVRSEMHCINVVADLTFNGLFHSFAYMAAEGDEFTIIGNTTDNPELLEGKK